MAAHPTKLQTYTRLAADNSAVITSNFANWSAFLVTASKMYKYTFLEQLMIHIQRPQATACAEYGTWSDEMRRYVRRFAKGIAVISFIDGKPTLRYVFDVADTAPKEGALYPFLWENRDEYQSVIPAALEGRFKVPCDRRGLPIQLANIAAQLAGQYWNNGEEQIIASIGDGPSGLTGDTFQDAAAASITYALLSRCGLHPEQFFDASDFTNVYKFNTFRMVLALGTAVSRCNEAVLRCIETSVKQYERDKRAGKLTKAPVPTAPAPVPSSAPAAPPVLAPEVEQPQSEDSSEVPDVQTFGASFVPPPEDEEEERDAQQKIPMLPLALSPTLPPADNYHITDDRLGEGGPKAKFQMNVEAIKVLNHIEADGRTATREEQEVLSRYVGWGGIPDAFDPDKPDWTDEYAELKSLLTEDEYASAQASTLNAHYTTPTVIRAIYEALGNMGFVAGNILEPSCGVGNFFGCLPESMAGSKLYGVELDFITARIAQQLYPKADIVHGGFESTDRRDFFDIAVGNVPFGNYSVNDPVYNKYNFSIHNYFLCKALDQLRPGGIMAFVTSRYTMDSKDSAARRYLAERADLLGAIRLPSKKKGLSAKSIRNVHGILHKALQQAVVSNKIRSNPASGCKPPRAVPKEIQPLYEDQIPLFLDAIEGHCHEYIFKLALFTGMREGEVLGLMWDCVDFRRGTIHIKRQLCKEKSKGGRYYFAPPKNGKSRMIAPAPDVMELLRVQKEKQEEQKLRAGELWGDTGIDYSDVGGAGLVFTNALGEHISYRTVYDCFRRVMDKLDIPGHCVHDLRHTYAVLSLLAGDDVKTLQENMGHATAAFTLDKYAHVTEQMRRSSSNRMQQYINNLTRGKRII